MVLLKLFGRRLMFVAIFLAFLFIEKGFSQIKRVEIIGAYIYKFAQQTEIIKYKSLETYNIVLISEDDEITEEFRNIITQDKIHNKPIYINIYNNVNINYNDASIIFIAEDKLDLYPIIFEKTKNMQILLVTENYHDKRKVMINLVENKNGNITFEVNKGNIYGRKINISEEMLLSGGSEIDIVELYLESQKKLTQSEKELELLQSDILELNSQFKEAHEEAILQQKEIKRQEMLIYNQKHKQDSLLFNLKTYKSNIENQRFLFINENKRLKALFDSLAISKNMLIKQKAELNEGLKSLQNLKDEIRKKNVEVKVQESTLGEQYDIIRKQRKINTLFIIAIILGVILLIGLIIGFIYRRRKNATLQKQQEEISLQNFKIKEHLEKKRIINNLLKSNNEELTTAMEQLKNTQEQLVQSEKMASLGVITAGIAHEINNPINFIYTGINSLQKDFDDVEIILNKIKDLNSNDNNIKQKIEEIQILKKENYFEDALGAMPQTMNDIKIGAERTAEIVDGLRKFSRMGENKFIISDIHELIQTALLMLKNKYKDVIKIVRNFDDNLPSIYCNPGKITQVLMNIIYNAIDAINDKDGSEREIIITTNYKNKEVRVSIKDNGTGINEYVKDKLFDPFFTTKEVGKGTGLGLSISYGIVKEHKGEIKVYSEDRKGTEFIIILPSKK